MSAVTQARGGCPTLEGTDRRDRTGAIGSRNVTQMLDHAEIPGKKKVNTAARVALVALVTLIFIAASVATAGAAAAAAGGAGFAMYLTGATLFGAAAIASPIIAKVTGMFNGKEGAVKDYCKLTAVTATLAGIGMGAVPGFNAMQENGLFGESELDTANARVDAEHGEYQDAQNHTAAEQADVDKAQAELTLDQNELSRELDEQRTAESELDSATTGVTDAYASGAGQHEAISAYRQEIVDFDQNLAELEAAQAKVDISQANLNQEQTELRDAESIESTQLAEYLQAVKDRDAILARLDAEIQQRADGDKSDLRQ
ncbi:MAG: hypothetical protein ACI8RA_000989 [Chlamydiales bacterium]|jgi:hypothetical protein